MYQIDLDIKSSTMQQLAIGKKILIVITSWLNSEVSVVPIRVIYWIHNFLADTYRASFWENWA